MVTLILSPPNFGEKGQPLIVKKVAYITYHRPVVVAHAEWSLSIPEVCGSNPIIGKI